MLDVSNRIDQADNPIKKISSILNFPKPVASIAFSKDFPLLPKKGIKYS